MALRQVQSEAFLLDVTNLGDGDRIVTLLTPHHGRKRGVARGARRKYSRFAGQLQPLARLEVGWFERDTHDLVRIREVTVIDAAGWLHRDLETLLVGAYLAEHGAQFAQDNEPNERMFRLYEATTAALALGADRSAVARYFEVWMLRLAGIFAPQAGCPLCERRFGDDGAVLQSGGDSLVCGRCAAGPGLQVAGHTLDLLHEIGRRGPAEVASAAPGVERLAEVEELCREIRRRFLGHELRSYEVMRRTLEEVGAL